MKQPLYKETFTHNDGITQKEYFNQRIDDVEEKIELRFDSVDKALVLATDQMDKRLEGMNEFRAQLKDQSYNFLTKDAYEVRHQLIENKIETLQKFMWITMGIVMAIEFAFKFLIK